MTADNTSSPDQLRLDPDDVDLAIGAGPVLRPFNLAGVLQPAEVYAAQRLSSLVGERRPEVLLAAALTVRALRQGSVCLDLGELVPAEFAVTCAPTIDPKAMLAAVADSPLVASGVDARPGAKPLVLSGTSLYLSRYHEQEELVAATLDHRARRGQRRLLDQGNDSGLPVSTDTTCSTGSIERLFGDDPEVARQRFAALLARSWPLVVVAGGPGTGKTTAVARLLGVLLAEARGAGGRQPRVALAAPTGKAAARLSEAVAQAVAAMPEADVGGLTGLKAQTLHRLLGARPGGTFTRNAQHPLAEDIVVVDESSMVSLSMMARLFAAVGSHTSMILVGDPDQLASVEAGAVLADIVGRASASPLDPSVGAAVTELSRLAGLDLDDSESRLAARGIVHLTHRFRFSGAIEALADAIVSGDADAAVRVLTAGHETDSGAAGSVARLILLGEREDPADALADAVRSGALTSIRDRVRDSASALRTAAESGDAQVALSALREHQLLTAHRSGPFGATWWQRQVDTWLREDLPGYGEGPWFAGRPVMATTNDRELGVFNGDTGVVVSLPGSGNGAGTTVVFGSPENPILVSPGRLGPLETMNALTIHKSQGSQYRLVSLILPPPSSPLLTRELLYTAVTRAESEVLVVGTPEAVAAAIARPVRRASGLRMTT